MRASALMLVFSFAVVSIDADPAPPYCGWMVPNSNISFAWNGESSACSPGNNPCDVGERVTFVAVSFGYPLNCLPHHFHWDFGDGGEATGRLATYEFPRRSSFPVTLTITNERQSVRMTRMVRVTQPIADPMPLDVQPVPGTAREFRFTLLGGATGEALWDFGDGTTYLSDAATQTHRYAKAGTYTVRVYAPSLVYLATIRVEAARQRSAHR